MSDAHGQTVLDKSQVRLLQSVPAYNVLIALAESNLAQALDQYVNTAPASEFLRGRVHAAREFLQLLRGN